MERSKRIEAGEFQLPEAVIQHIQSYLSEKEAAQTTVLSKSWYGAWSTRPNINFDQDQFRRNFCHENSDSFSPDRFSEFARKTMRRYEELNLKIESFRLFFINPEKNDNSCYLDAEELIVRAMKMGVSDLSIEFLIQNVKFIFAHEVKFILPHEVLGSENLVSLSMSAGQIDLGADEKVKCSSLKSLSLCKVYAEGDIIWDIVSSCPLLENLSLDECECSYIDHNRYFSTKRTRKLESGPINRYGFHQLKYLMLMYVKIDPLFFRDFSSRFPCLKDLYLDQCLSSKKIEIYSRTLECIRIKQIVMLRAKIDAPSLRKFTLSSGHIPSLTFGTTPKEWEADIHATCSNISYAWFRQFKKFVTRLSSSKFSLSFGYIPNWRDSFDNPGDIRSRYAVENLTLSTSVLESSLFWDGLFWSCRPKFITIPGFSRKYGMAALEGVCNRLTLLDENGRIPNKSMFAQFDLEEVNVEFFDKNVAEWRPLPWGKTLDVSTLTGYDEKVRFHLRWGP